MPGTITCLHCDKTVPRNPRCKNQKYCSAAACQNARKRQHERDTDSTFKGKTRRKARNKRWRNNAPAHEYMHKYREGHPDYKAKNREKQHERNKNRRSNESSSMIVKTDALLLQPSDDGVYTAFRVKKSKDYKKDCKDGHVVAPNPGTIIDRVTYITKTGLIVKTDTFV
jgi:hypothetical protein